MIADDYTDGTGGPAEDAQMREDGCMRADKACRWRPATTSDANPKDLVCDGCGARQRPVSELERIEDLRDEYPQNGPAAGSVPEDGGRRLVDAANAVLAVFNGGPDTGRRTTRPDGVECCEVPMYDLAPVLLDLEMAAAAPVEPGDGGEALRREVERLCVLYGPGESEDVTDEGEHYVTIRELRAALAAAAVRERREVRP